MRVLISHHLSWTWQNDSAYVAEPSTGAPGSAFQQKALILLILSIRSGNDVWPTYDRMVEAFTGFRSLLTAIFL
jgi:hypothetical protein